MSGNWVVDTDSLLIEYVAKLSDIKGAVDGNGPPNDGILMVRRVVPL